MLTDSLLTHEVDCCIIATVLSLAYTGMAISRKPRCSACYSFYSISPSFLAREKEFPSYVGSAREFLHRGVFQGLCLTAYHLRYLLNQVFSTDTICRNSALRPQRIFCQALPFTVVPTHIRSSEVYSLRDIY